MKKYLSLALLMSLVAVGSARAEPILFSAVLTGSAESPPNASPGLGVSVVAYDPTLRSLQVLAGFTGLIAPTIAAHIHCCTTPSGTAPPATPVPSFPGFPTGVTSGLYTHFLDLSSPASFNPAFLAASGGTALTAELALAQGLATGMAYLNIHTTAFPAGEIRGFFSASTTPAPIPEPATVLLVGGAVAGLAATRRRNRRR